MNRNPIILIALFMAAIGSAPALEQDQSLQPRATLTVETLKQLDTGVYEVPDSHNLLLTYIPAGEFEMGSPETEIGRQADEPRHTVKITRPFYMGVAPVTQGDTQTFFAFEMNSPFGRRTPNVWGLYDIHGGVYEWVQDWYGPYNAKETSDPQGPETGQERVLRGGCTTSMQGDDPKSSPKGWPARDSRDRHLREGE